MTATPAICGKPRGWSVEKSASERENTAPKRGLSIDRRERPTYRRSVDGPALIRLVDVVKHYETPAGDFPALKGVALEVGRGEFVAVIGKSGSGKSTLVNMITGIDRPTS